MLKGAFMAFNITEQESQELKSLLEWSIEEIRIEIRHTTSSGIKSDLNKKKESLLSILERINSSSKQKAA
jgi:hypothetical protein